MKVGGNILGFAGLIVDLRIKFNSAFFYDYLGTEKALEDSAQDW